MNGTAETDLGANNGHGTGGNTLSLLEFPLILEKIARFTSLPLAREGAMALRPSSHAAEIQRLQQGTQEARRFIDGKGSLDLTGIGDVRTLVQRAMLEGVLRGEHLREIYDTLRACRGARSILANRMDLPQMSDLARSIPSLRELEDELNSAIDRNGLITDNASGSLRHLRRRAEESHARLTTALERAMRRLQTSNVLQENLVTERNGRMVLLVKSEMRSRVPGIIHDMSDSGATAFVEPLSAMPLGNQWRESSLAAQREEERILGSLSSKVGLHGNSILGSLDILAELDLTLAKGRFSAAIKGVPPVFVEANESYVKLVGARHPLLKDSVVPIDISVGGDDRILLITGPNAGGKTVALKTTGLVLAMAQAGLHVPARQCAMTIFDSIFADIGDQQSIELSLSSFSSHLQNLGNIMDKATSASLVLLDELGASTDPEEGAALAKAVLSYFSQHSVSCVATTHHRDVAAYAQEQPGMTNASVELNAETLAPTYSLTLGLPGRSYALTIARRMGIDSETLELAQSLLSAEHRQAEELLRELERERHLAEQHRKAARKESVIAQAKRRDLEEKLSQLEGDKALILEQFRRDIEAQADELWKRLRRAERTLAQPESRPQLKDQRIDVTRVRNEIRSSLWQPSEESAKEWIKVLRPETTSTLEACPIPLRCLRDPITATPSKFYWGRSRPESPLTSLRRKPRLRL